MRKGDPDHSFQALCHEAVLACGEDLEAIRRYVDARIASLNEADRGLIARDIERVLAYAPTDRLIWEQ